MHRPRTGAVLALLAAATLAMLGFTGVAFASFGTPTGTCATGLAVNPACNAATSAAVVAAECLGFDPALVVPSKE